MHEIMSSRRQRLGLSRSSVGSVAFAWGKANFVTYVSQWTDVVIVRRKPLRRLGNAMDDMGGSTVGSRSDFMLDVKKRYEEWS